MQKTLTPSPRAGAPRNPKGVIATMERLTGVCPLPNEIRDIANKYLRSAELFPKQPGEKNTNESKLARLGAHNLILNALTLDEIFSGNTKLVVRILLGEASEGEISKHCLAALDDIERRAKVYGYWQQRVPLVKQTIEGMDFRETRIDDLLAKAPLPFECKLPAPYALRAIRTLERIEEHPRLQGVRASDLVEQAEAYLALEDYAGAAVRARRAIDMEPNNAQAWFIRVVSALKSRNKFLAETQRHRMEASEVAEPMSAHERSAYEAADDASSKAAESQDTLDAIVPQALLNWPKNQWGGYEHHAWRQKLLLLMLNQAFRKVSLSGYPGPSKHAFELNGFGPEWALKLNVIEWGHLQKESAVQLPLNQSEIEAVELIFSEHDRFGLMLFPLGGFDIYAAEMQVVHLRWILGNQGYEQHWHRFAADNARMDPERFSRTLLCHHTLAPIWFAHTSRHGGTEAVQAALEKWKVGVSREAQREIIESSLGIHVMAFHYQFARADYAGCIEKCGIAQSLLTDSKIYATSFSHPFESAVTVPAGHLLYWQYLAALAAVMMRSSGQDISPKAKAILDHAEVWQQKFHKTEECFWTESEEYEWGGGEDYLISPYDIDLRESEHWVQPIRDRDRPFTTVSV